MRSADYVTGALSTIWAAKLRTLLTALGIIGVGSMVLLVGIGAGVEATIIGSPEQLHVIVLRKAFNFDLFASAGFLRAPREGVHR